MMPLIQIMLIASVLAAFTTGGAAQTYSPIRIDTPGHAPEAAEYGKLLRQQYEWTSPCGYNHGNVYMYSDAHYGTEGAVIGGVSSLLLTLLWGMSHENDDNQQEYTVSTTGISFVIALITVPAGAFIGYMVGRQISKMSYLNSLELTGGYSTVNSNRDITLKLKIPLR